MQKLVAEVVICLNRGQIVASPSEVCLVHGNTTGMVAKLSDMISVFPRG